MEDLDLLDSVGNQQAFTICASLSKRRFLACSFTKHFRDEFVHYIGIRRTERNRMVLSFQTALKRIIY